MTQEGLLQDCHIKYEIIPHNLRNPFRAFDPNWNELYNGQVSDLVGQCPHCQHTRVKIQNSANGRNIDGNAVVIAIDGACRGNSTLSWPWIYE
jgi:hypothetical protein